MLKSRCVWLGVVAMAITLCAIPSISWSAPTRAHGIALTPTRANTITAVHVGPARYLGMRSLTLGQAQALAIKGQTLFRQTQQGMIIQPFLTRMGPAAYRAAKVAALHGFAPHMSPNIRDENFALQRNVVTTTVPTIALDGMSNGPWTATGTKLSYGTWPPDGAVAANAANEVVEAINSSVGDYTWPAGMTIGFPLDMNSFFGGGPYSRVSSCNGGAYPKLTDPRAFYDQLTKHFWITDMQLDGVNEVGDTCPNQSVEWFAVSKTSSLSGGWYIYDFEVDSNATTANQELADFPTLGYDDASKMIVSCFNDFNFVSTAFDGATCLSLDKAGMEAGTGPANSQYAFGLTAPAYLGWPGIDTVQPADTIAYGTHDPGRLYLSTTVNAYSTGSDNRVLTIQCGGTPGACFTGAIGVVSKIRTYAFPPNADVNGSPIGPCVACLETGDNRISATPVYSIGYGGVISFAIETNVNNGTQNVPTVEFVENEITPVGVTLRQNQYIVGTGDTARSYGATIEKTDGSLFMVYDQMGKTENQNVRITVHRPTDPINAFEFAVYCKAPVGPYTFPMYNSIFRWGDYSAAAYNLTNIWVMGEYGGGNTDWATRLCEDQ